MFNDFETLRSGFQQSWYKFLFKNTALAKRLAQPEPLDPYAFFETYLSSSWWNRLWFRSRIQNPELLNIFDSTLQTVQLLKKHGLFNEANYRSIPHQTDAFNFKVALGDLEKKGMLTQDNFDRVAAHRNLDKLCEAMYMLLCAVYIYKPRKNNYYTLSPNLTNLFNQENFDVVAQSDKPYELTLALAALQDKFLLTQYTRDLLAAHPKPQDVAKAIVHLRKNEVFTEANHHLIIDAIARHQNPNELAQALVHLNTNNMLSRQDLNMLKTTLSDLARIASPLIQAKGIVGRRDALKADFERQSLGFFQPADTRISRELELASSPQPKPGM